MDDDDDDAGDAAGESLEDVLSLIIDGEDWEAEAEEDDAGDADAMTLSQLDQADTVKSDAAALHAPHALSERVDGGEDEDLFGADDAEDDAHVIASLLEAPEETIAGPAGGIADADLVAELRLADWLDEMFASLKIFFARRHDLETLDIGDQLALIEELCHHIIMFDAHDKQPPTQCNRLLAGAMTEGCLPILNLWL